MIVIHLKPAHSNLYAKCKNTMEENLVYKYILGSKKNTQWIKVSYFIRYLLYQFEEGSLIKIQQQK